MKNSFLFVFITTEILHFIIYSQYLPYCSIEKEFPYVYLNDGESIEFDISDYIIGYNLNFTLEGDNKTIADIKPKFVNMTSSKDFPGYLMRFSKQKLLN